MKKTGKINFGTTLHAVMRENGMSMADVGKASDTAAGQMSKFKAGKWQVIPEERLTALLDAACKTAEQRQRCIMAYVVDMVPENDRPMLFISKPKPETGLAAVNAELNLQFKRIAVAIKKSDDFKRMFTTLASWAKSISGS